jgi:SAM-dependent methyltransferase
MMSRTSIALWAALAAVPWTGVALSQHRISADNLAPFVPTPELVVVKMLEAAELKPGETLYDLGCGDGRILFVAAQKFGANAVGVELSSKLVGNATERALHLGLQRQVKVVQGNLLDINLQAADVVTLYLMRLSNERLKPNLRKQLKPGARVVSHDYPIPGWKPQRVESVSVLQRVHTIYVYRMPPVE